VRRTRVDRGLFRTVPSAVAGAPDMRRIMATAADVAGAMAYLHSKSIMHGDLTGGACKQRFGAVICTCREQRIADRRGAGRGAANGAARASGRRCQIDARVVQRPVQYVVRAWCVLRVCARSGTPLHCCVMRPTFGTGGGLWHRCIGVHTQDCFIGGTETETAIHTNTCAASAWHMLSAWQVTLVSCGAGNVLLKTASDRRDGFKALVSGECACALGVPILPCGSYVLVHICSKPGRTACKPRPHLRRPVHAFAGAPR